MTVTLPSPGTTILVVDDERGTREVAYRILSEHGYRVFEAGSAEEAMRVLQLAHRYTHLVILDVVMPVVDGVALGREILEKWPSLRLLYMSAYSADVLLKHGLTELPMRFLPKPFTADELLDTVRHSLDRRRAPRLRDDAQGLVDHG